jgi:hypothetical protein
VKPLKIPARFSYPKVSSEVAPSIQAPMGLADEWAPWEDVEVDEELVQ